MNANQICSKLKEEREKKGLSLNALSQIAPITRQTIRNVDEAKNPALATVISYAEAIGLEVVLKSAKNKKREDF